LKFLYLTPYRWSVNVLDRPIRAFIKLFAKYYSKKTVILGTFRVVGKKVVYTDIDKVVVHKLFGFPVLVHSSQMTETDWQGLIT